LGLAAGAAYGGLFFWLTKDSAMFATDKAAGSLYFGGLLPIRFGEWFFIIWYFYQRGKPNHVLLVGNTVVGIVWSYVLDAVGIFTAIVIPGGVWIC
jgi:hypothetical protein